MLPGFESLDPRHWLSALQSRLDELARWRRDLEPWTEQLERRLRERFVQHGEDRELVQAWNRLNLDITRLDRSAQAFYALIDRLAAEETEVSGLRRVVEQLRPRESALQDLRRKVDADLEALEGRLS